MGDFTIFVNLPENHTCSWDKGNIYLLSKVVCFVLSSWDLPNHGTSCQALGIFGKLSMSRGALTWFASVSSYDVEVIDYWIIFLMKTKLNQNWNLYWSLGGFVLLESPQQSKFNKVYFTIFRVKTWKIWIFEWSLLLEIQTNCKNSVVSSMCSHCWI